jgi:hypothetical protein
LENREQSVPRDLLRLDEIHLHVGARGGQDSAEAAEGCFWFEQVEQNKDYSCFKKLVTIGRAGRRVEGL